MRKGSQIRKSGHDSRSNFGIAGIDAVEQPRRISVSEACSVAPPVAGAYRFWDHAGNVLYVGKAVNLRNRIRSHLGATDNSPRHRLMISRAATIDWIATPNDVEALLLEDMLIKRHRPDFNVRFRDDKRYPIIRLDVTNPFPSLSVVRRFQNDGALYFGPFTSSKTMRTILRVIERYFPLRRCQGSTDRSDRECLNFQMHKCPGVCRHNIDCETYARTVNEVQLLLSGRNDELIQQLQQEMILFSESMNYEAAAIRRDQIEAVKNVAGGRKLLLPRPVDLDVFAFEASETIGYGEVMLVRSGMIYGNLHLNLHLDQNHPIERIAEYLITHYYSQLPPIPKAVITNCEPTNKESIELLLKSVSGRSVKIYSKIRGIRRKLILLTLSNLKLHRKMQRSSARSDALDALRSILNLNDLPSRIEAVDVSESQGRHSVGSVVSFMDGKPEKSRYRRFRIQSIEAKSDLDRIQEVMRRRLRRRFEKGWELPDLFLIDGGLQQLKTAKSVFIEAGIADIPVISVAKARGNRLSEGVFIEKGQEVRLPPHDPALLFLDRIRDEAHRFAITYHRILRDRNTLRSLLTETPGIGPKGLRKLLDHFESISSLKAADATEIANVAGYGIQKASKLKQSIEARGFLPNPPS